MFAFFYLLFLMGCNDYLIKSSDNEDNLLMIYPDVLDFGHIEVRSETGQDSFGVINAGDHTVIITNPVLDLDEKFSLDEDLAESYEIEPGEFLSFEVYYNPLTFEDNYDLITVETESGDVYDLPVVGWGDAAVIEATPIDNDFGEININCENELTLNIKNSGNLNLSVEQISQIVTSPQDITIDYGTLPDFPWEILPNQQIDFFVKYYPLDVGLDESKLTISSNDPLNPDLEVFYTGHGEVDYTYTDTFTQEETSVLDIIFVVDNSGSMRLLHNQLAVQINNFVNVLRLIGSDYHIGVVTTDSSFFVINDNIGWIDSSYATPSLWMTDVIYSIGIHGNASEMGIENAHKVLLGDASPSSSFWRDESILSIIYVSDEPDVSTNGFQSYFYFFDNIKDPGYHKQYAVIGDYPSGCYYSNPGSSTVRSIMFGSGYYEMTQRYGGEWYSICAADWGIQLQNLANNLASRNRFQLSEPDVVGASVIVSVNGQIVSNWYYEQLDNSVVFDNGHVPESGQTVTIEYTVWRCYE